jgi:hypothetical protein
MVVGGEDWHGKESALGREHCVERSVGHKMEEPESCDEE